MDSTLCIPSTHQRPNCPKFQSNYDGLGNRLVHVKTGNKTNSYRDRKTNRRAKKLSPKALFGSGGDDFRAIMRIVKLNSAIQNRSIREFVELIGDECQYFFGIISTIDLSQLGKNVFVLIHAMMLRHHVSFVLKPTEDEGFDLGIKWALEWKGQKLPWNLDCNVSTAHAYKGLLLISQVNKAFGPLLQRLLRLIQQNLDAVIWTLTSRVMPEGMLDENKSSTTIICVVIGLVTMALFYVLFKNVQV